MRLRKTVLALGLAFGWSGPGHANDFVGLWQTEEGKGQVELSECGDRLCSEIVWLREAVDDRGRPLRDRNNPDPNLRDRPVVGLEILQGLRQSARGEYSGEIYNPENGETYLATIRLDDRNTLRLEGCTSWGWPCGEQIWTRARESSETQQMARADVTQPPQGSQPRADDRQARGSLGGGEAPGSRANDRQARVDGWQPGTVRAEPTPPARTREDAPAPGSQSGERTPEQSARAPASPPQMRPSRTPMGERYHVQVAARQSEAEAREAFVMLQRRHPGLLGDYSPDIRMADLGAKGIWYRVSVGPMAERRAASELCARMKAEGGDCLIRGP